MARRSCLVVLTLLLLAAGDVRAAPPDARKVELAEQLHKRALAAARDGEFARAAGLWEEAEALYGSWKYAFNRASVLTVQKNWMAAWKALERSDDYGVPEAHRPKIQGVRLTVESALLKTYARLQVSVSPSGATVKRGGVVWKPPLEVWTTDEESVLEVSADGYETVTQTVSHPIGFRHRETIGLAGLVEAPNRGFGAWKWVSLGVGAAAATAGIGFLAWSEALVSDAEGLDWQASDYNARYDDLQASHSMAQVSGWALAASGAALVTVGVVLVVLEGSDGEGRVTVTPTVSGRGAGFTATGRF